MNLFFKSLIVPTYFFTKSIEFIALAWTTGKNKVNCTFEGQQLLSIDYFVGKDFFSKWANSSGHFLRVNSCGQKCPREVLFLGEFSWKYFG